MCTNYTPSARDYLRAQRLGVEHLPERDWPLEVFPGYEAPIVIAAADAGTDLHAARCVLARFGLIPRWSKDAATATDIARRTYNARSETVAEKPSYRSPWRERHLALAPMQNFFEPCWEDAAAHGNKGVRWRIERSDGAPFAAAALWERWTDPSSGEIVTSFSLLTVNADAHPLLKRMHRPGEEKRSLALLPEQDYAKWLHASLPEAVGLLRAPPDDWLRGEPAPLPTLRRAKRAPPQEPPEQGGLF